MQNSAAFLKGARSRCLGFNEIKEFRDISDAETEALLHFEIDPDLSLAAAAVCKQRNFSLAGTTRGRSSSGIHQALK